MESILKMTDIDKSYYVVKALNKVKFEVKKGEVHALIGANGAGKSTLMKVLCGELDYEGGPIIFDGVEINPRSGIDIRELGIIMIHQELSTIHELTAAQYIYVGREPMKGIFIDDKKMSKDAKVLLDEIGAEFSPDTKMGDLSIAQQQLVEISKALSYNVKLLILDEPTTALGEKETQKVFEIITKLKSQGVSVIYISHRLEELFIISDRITVMRDGEYITTLDTKSTEKGELIKLFAGREVKIAKKLKSSVPENAKTVLEVKNLSSYPMPDDISFSLKQGEILGLAGLMGSGRTETAKALCGITPKISGEVFINGKEVTIRNPKEAVENGICYLSEDRNDEGLIFQRSIIGNTVLSSLDNYQHNLALKDEDMLNDAVEFNNKVKTKYADPHSPVSSLSGGNAQKVVIARWLLRGCPILIFDEPTKGIDVGAKDEIYQIMSEITKSGQSIIMISSETDELLSNCDRIIVLYEGKITGELNIEDANQQKIMALASGDCIK